MSARLSARLVAARTAILAGEVATAGAHLSGAMELAAGDDERAEVLCLRARLAVLQGDAAALLPELLGFSAAARPAPAGLVLMDAVILQLYAGDPGAVAHAERARALLAAADAVTRAKADVVLGVAQVFSGRAADAEAMLARSVDLIRLGGAPDEVAHVLQQVVVGLAGRELYEEGVALCRRSIRAARSVGAVGLLPLMLCYLANTVYFVAGFAEQEMAAAEALDLARTGGQGPVAAYARVCRGVAAGMRGDADFARRELEACLGDLEATGAGTFRNLTLHGLAMLDLGGGDWAAAVRAYERLRANWERDRVTPGVLHWRGDEIEACWRAGDRARARSLLDDLAAEAVDYGPWEQAVVARLRGLTGDPGAAGDWFAEAMRRHGETTSAFEQARTAMCWGEWLLGHGRPTDAVPVLRAARDGFREVDTPAWARRAEALLREAGLGDGPAVRAAADFAGPGREGFRITALGPLTVTSPDGTSTRVALDTPGNLLRLLVVEGGSARTEQVVDRLWPETPMAQGGARLRTVLTRARQRYGPVVLREGAVLRWSDDVEVDARQFEALHRQAVAPDAGQAAAGLARAAIAMYADDLLVLERYDDTVIVARERMRRRYLDLLDLLSAHERASGNLQGAADLLRAGVERDHLDEVRYFELAEVLLELGRTGSARAVLARAAEVLAELGMGVPDRLALLMDRC